MRALGIDFGTSNTVAVVRAGAGAAQPLLFDGAPLLPSAVYRDPSGSLLAGRDAERAARLDPSRYEPNPKRRVDDGAVLLGEAEVPVDGLVAAVLAIAAAEARRWLGEVYELVMTHPADWSARRRSVLVSAATRAGMPAPLLVPEPVAAASYFTGVLRAAVPPGAALAVYDLGGGTFDAAVVRRSTADSDAGFDVLAASGLTDVGGLDVDQALVDHLRRVHPSEVWDGLVNPVDAAGRRARALLYDDVRGAKETLSRAPFADVHLPLLDVAAHVTRDELETLVRPMVARTVACLARTVAEAGIGAEDLVGVFLVGGSSRIPLVARMIHQELGIAPTAIEQPETAVALGAVDGAFDGTAAAAHAATARLDAAGPPIGSVAGRGPTAGRSHAPGAARPVSGQPTPPPYQVSTLQIGGPGSPSTPPSTALPTPRPRPAPQPPPAPAPANTAGLAWVVVLSVACVAAAITLLVLLLNG